MDASGRSLNVTNWIIVPPIFLVLAGSLVAIVIAASIIILTIRSRAARARQGPSDQVSLFYRFYRLYRFYRFYRFL